MATATVAIDRELWKQAKSVAALQDRTLADLIEEAVKDLLKKNGSKK